MRKTTELTSHSMAGATILRIAYGIDVQLPENGHYIGIAEEAIISASLTGNAGSYLGAYTSATL